MRKQKPTFQVFSLLKSFPNHAAKTVFKIFLIFDDVMGLEFK